MNKYNIELSRKANKYLQTLNKKTRTRVFNHLKLLSDNPRHPELDIKKFQGMNNIYRLRIGDFRILYSIIDKSLLVIVVKIGSRGDVYK